MPANSSCRAAPRKAEGVEFSPSRLPLEFVGWRGRRSLRSSRQKMELSLTLTDVVVQLLIGRCRGHSLATFSVSASFANANPFAK